MAVIVKYVVERNGEEKMTFTSKAEADAYDKMLDMADDLFTLLENSQLIEDDDKKEELSLYLAQNKEEVLYALGAKRRPAVKNTAEKKPVEKKDVAKLEDKIEAEESKVEVVDEVTASEAEKPVAKTARKAPAKKATKE